MTHSEEDSTSSGKDAQYDPLAPLLLPPEELTSFRRQRQDAYVSEQFAHLFSAVWTGEYLA
ncbi:hypothetical protein AQF52_0149 [Streptomyces venezuelae]|nr:hypothetical protein AQF52_0149 [Streptomyces venezuelae]CUM44057.1 hypothetical protein BN2537_17079 [Streptomyces venezuelae]